MGVLTEITFCCILYYIMVMLRDPRSQFMIDCFEAGQTAADCAREMNVSRQRLHQLIKYYNINYEKYKNRLYAKRIVKKAARICQLCEKPFVPRFNGSRINFCSDNCYIQWRKGYNKVWHREYYRSPAGKKYKAMFRKKQYEKRLPESKTCLTCGKDFHPRVMHPKMVYCSRQCYFNRKKGLDK